jgi:hypothetical protein
VAINHQKKSVPPALAVIEKGVKTSKRFGRQRLNEIPGPCIYRTEQTAARILLR